MVKRWTVAATVAVTVVGTLAACSSSGNKGGSSGSASAAPTTGTSSGSTGTSKPATGSPISIYFINEQGSTTGASYPQETTAAQAAVEYINKKLGGVNGHPIKMTTCFTNATPSATNTCVNKAVAAKPLLVTAGSLADDNDIIAVTAKTDIPYVSNAGFTAQTLTAKGKSFIISNYADASDLAMAQLMKENGVKHVAEVYVNVPGVVGGLLPLTEQVYKHLGITYDKYPVAYPTADMTPTISAIAGTKAEAIHFQADPITCGAALSAVKALGYNKPLYAPSACRNAANNKLIGGLSQTVYTQVSALPSTTTSDPDVAIENEVFKANSTLSKLMDDQWAVDGFTDIWNIYAALVKAVPSGGQPSRSALISTLQAGGLHQFMLGQDVKYTCDGSVFPSLPALCSLYTLLGVWKGDKITDLKTYNGADALK
jgi:branched-chain amino acid transport system substrate-binding protein